MGCDVFISYRRKDGVYPAMILYRDLVEAGYNVFYDIASIRNGSFPKLLEDNILSCTDFLLLVTPGTFSKRIFEPNDWVHKEIRLALEHNKNIIPIFIGKAAIPAELPEDIAQINEYNGVMQIDPQMTHDINRKMFKEYLRSSHNLSNTNSLVHSRCSVYDASYGDEFQRLQTQAVNSLHSDMDVINKHTEPQKNYTVLDVGCAYGFVGKSRFEDGRFTKIIGIDKNEKCINEAQKRNTDSRFSYYLTDIEAENFENELGAVMAQNNLDGFDIIFAALVIHHLKDPQKFLKRIRKYLKDGGIIIIRGSDDGSKLAYNDNGLMKEIIALTTKISNVSDRFNGRKIYTQLLMAGYRNVSMFSYMRDLSLMDYDERAALFNESFSYRINYVRRPYENDPANTQKKEDFNKMEELLVKFEERFYDQSFWYCEYDYIGVARKK